MSVHAWYTSVIPAWVLVCHSTASSSSTGLGRLPPAEALGSVPIFSVAGSSSVTTPTTGTPLTGVLVSTGDSALFHHVPPTSSGNTAAAMVLSGVARTGYCVILQLLSISPSDPKPFWGISHYGYMGAVMSPI